MTGLTDLVPTLIGVGALVGLLILAGIWATVIRPLRRLKKSQPQEKGKVEKVAEPKEGTTTDKEGKGRDT